MDFIRIQYPLASTVGYLIYTVGVVFYQGPLDRPRGVFRGKYFS
jgi:hypothetical protein